MTETRALVTSEPGQPIVEDAAATSGSLRSLAVTIGPSVVLDGLLALSTAATLSSVVRGPSGRLARVGFRLSAPCSCYTRFSR